MKYAVIGHKGFLGGAIAKRLGEVDVFPNKETKVLFHFGSFVHIPFEQNPDYHMHEVINSFLYLLPYCRDHNIYFVYPSSALVYEKNTTFVKSKKILEMLASCYPNTLGLRIFPVYGPGEDRTVITQWCRAVKEGKQPIVYGDGNQARDFIYIDDVVDQILLLTEQRATGIRDIGTGKLTSFSSILEEISKTFGTHIEAQYIAKPEGYSEGIFCKDPLPTKVTLKEGIKNILDLLRKDFRG